MRVDNRHRRTSIHKAMFKSQSSFLRLPSHKFTWDTRDSIFPSHSYGLNKSVDWVAVSLGKELLRI